MFVNEIKKISKEHEKVKIFVDMDGTIAEWPVYDVSEADKFIKGYSQTKPLPCIIEILKEISEIPNVTVNVATLSKNKEVTKKKEEWLERYTPFISPENWSIIDKEKGDYTPENRSKIKGKIILEKSEENDYLILLDDEHEVLRETKKLLGTKGRVYHISSVLVE